MSLLKPFESVEDLERWWGGSLDTFKGRACAVCAGDASECSHSWQEMRLALTPLDTSLAPKPISNPKDSIGVRKVPASVVPRTVVAEVGLAMLEGACKYGRHNYRAAGIVASVNYDAAIRHLDDWWEGADNDPESGANLSHITKAIAALTVLRDGMIQGNWIDDRPPASPPGWQQKLSELAGVILDRFKDNKKEAFTQLTTPRGR